MTERRAKEKGFTLLELVLVLAVIAVLAAIFLPIGMNQLRQADITKANADVQQVAAALTQFFKDLRYFPACNSPLGNADCSPRVGTGATDNNNLKFLAVGEGAGDLSGKYPPGTTDPVWDFAANDDAATPAKNNAFNHLVVNDPVANATAGEVTDYPTTGRAWGGPYIARLGLDPWGNAYVISVGAMEADGTVIAANAKGWILSAGPNGTIETAPDDLVLGGDDIGFIYFTD